MTYALETRAEISIAIQTLEANEMKILRKTKIGKIRIRKITEPCVIQPISDWMEKRRTEWDEPVTRMDAEKLVKISRDVQKEDVDS